MDVNSALVQCVLQLAACSDKLRVTDALIGSYVVKAQHELAKSDLPTLVYLTAFKARLAVAPVGYLIPSNETFQDLLDLGAEKVESLELMKQQLASELRRRSAQFKDLVTSRNADLQEEYARMLNALDAQANALEKEITTERENQRKRKRIPTEATEHRSRHENEKLKIEIAHHEAEISILQSECEEIEERCTEDTEIVVSEEESEPKEEEITALRQEIELLRKTKESIATHDSKTLVEDYLQEKEEIDGELRHLKCAKSNAEAQLQAHENHLHALMRTLASNASIGTLMTRLHQQLKRASVGQEKGQELTHRTIELTVFLQSCPSVEEGHHAVEELQRLGLIHYYPSSGIIALAD